MTNREIEEETIRRCIAVAKDYAKSKTGSAGNRVWAAKAMAALEIVARLQTMTRKHG